MIHPTSPPVELLIVDDSSSVRAIIRAMVEGDDGIRIVGEAGSGLEAVEMVESHRPGVILMDVQMPGMNGIEATERIMASRATPIIAFSALTLGEEAKASIDMLAAGALDVMAKPDLSSEAAVLDCSRVLRKKILIASRVTVVRHLRHTLSMARGRRLLPGREVIGRYRAVGVGASTGGPAALREIFSRLSPTFPLPILVVQHITSGFTEGFAEWLQQHTSLRVRVARESDRAEPGTILMASEGRQMEVAADGTVCAASRKPCGVHLPSADVLLNSLASAYGKAAVGVLLTGMGADGAEGLLAVRRAGGLTLAQNEESCAVFGMPREAVRKGAVDELLPPASIAEMMREAAEPPIREMWSHHV
ncbi:MAG: chemotaxis-specific protein-glutamate methyltransferase CheB [Deltaproteobacteria bacterium]|nr:chemotaxis-specific protein-glutamate methyltransferase CheB [Deltaproteobacteria bacterium]